MKLLSGKEVCDNIYINLKKKVQKLKKKNIIPSLAVILVGIRKDSEVYVNMKHKKCQELGINSIIKKFDDTVNDRTLIYTIHQLNEDPNIHGILVQLPLPPHLNKDIILDNVSLKKDVDGFHAENMGRLALNRNPLYYPCTPAGCLELLDYYNINVLGKHIIMIGCSNIVGLPLILMLIKRNATVTSCHDKTQNIKNICQLGDIVITACGCPNMVKKTWLKKDAIIIDIGINKLDDNTKKKGYRLVGDVDFEDVKDHVSAITPVPGGIGPMTIATLMKHTIQAASL